MFGVWLPCLCRKPFTVNTSEAELLVELAQEKQLKVTVGHDDQFRHAARKCDG
jgi:predicted dehydrogenase